MEAEKIAQKLHPLERKVLPFLGDTSDFEKVVEKSGLQDVEVMRALQWLENKRIVTLKTEAREVIVLGKNGEKYLEVGLPEKRFLKAIKGKSSIDEIKSKSGIKDDEINITLGVLKRRAAINIEKTDEMMISLTDQGRNLLGKGFLEERFLEKEFPILTTDLSDEDRFAYSELKKRRDILKTEIQKTRSAKLTDTGKQLLKQDLDTDYIERLTPSIIKSDIWRKRKFRGYDVEINVPQIHGGKRHYVDQAIQDIKRIWLDLGFEEMSGNLVQTGFWNLDSLFVPQDHPARDEQDTFYVKDPKYGKLPKGVTERVKATHENGWKTGSKGWQYEWSEDIAKQNMLRTHTTVLSAQTLAGLKEKDLPAKFFSVKKCFRNETLSWKHLFEFIQVEGIVVDPDANFKHLVGYLKNFFAKLGFPDARVRPGHFPYTEPSAEVDVWHPRKKMWVELGGSGLFRPETVQPLMGKPIPVLAWGLGLERSIMENYKITDIRNLYSNDLEKLRKMKVW